MWHRFSLHISHVIMLLGKCGVWNGFDARLHDLTWVHSTLEYEVRCVWLFYTEIVQFN